MTLSPQDTQVPLQEQSKSNDKEYNFAQMRKQLDQERSARLVAEERAAQMERQSQAKPQYEDDDADDEPYVDKRKLKKELTKFGEQNKAYTQQEINRSVQTALEEERKTNYLKTNSDFNNVMSNDTIQKFADKHPGLAENILRMPEGFERQKLVYETIKALGVDRPDQKQPSIQDKVDANKRSPYYQPSGVGSAPYAGATADYSPAGQKNAYEQLLKLKANLRIG